MTRKRCSSVFDENTKRKFFLKKYNFFNFSLILKRIAGNCSEEQSPSIQIPKNWYPPHLGGVRRGFVFSSNTDEHLFLVNELRVYYFSKQYIIKSWIKQYVNWYHISSQVIILCIITMEQNIFVYLYDAIACSSNRHAVITWSRCCYAIHSTNSLPS